MRRLIVLLPLLAAFAVADAQTPRRRLLALADTHTGYTHDSIGHALAVIDDLGRQSGLYETFIRTDSQWITKQAIPLPARNTKTLNDFDAVFLFISGEGDWTAQQKNDFTIIHGASLKVASLSTLRIFPQCGTWARRSPSAKSFTCSEKSRIRATRSGCSRIWTRLALI
jgi:hypothetical protein